MFFGSFLITRPLIVNADHFIFTCCADKFEQFWAVNRRLMERTGDDPYFKFIPFRILQVHSFRFSVF